MLPSIEPLLKIALLIAGLMTAAAYLVLRGALDRGLGAGSAGARTAWAFR